MIQFYKIVFSCFFFNLFICQAGNVYRTTFNFFNPTDNESLSSVSSESGQENNVISYIPSQLNDQSNPEPMSTQSSETSSQQPNDRSTSSRRDDDGNVEFDCD